MINPLQESFLNHHSGDWTCLWLALLRFVDRVETEEWTTLMAQNTRYKYQQITPFLDCTNPTKPKMKWPVITNGHKCNYWGDISNEDKGNISGWPWNPQASTSRSCPVHAGRSRLALATEFQGDRMEMVGLEVPKKGQRLQKTMGNGGVVRFYDCFMGFHGINPPGKHLQNYGQSPFSSWENSLFRLGHVQ